MNWRLALWIVITCVAIAGGVVVTINIVYLARHGGFYS